LIHQMLNIRQSRKKKGTDMEMISRDATLLWRYLLYIWLHNL
jgi:hypothetical protein